MLCFVLCRLLQEYVVYVEVEMPQLAFVHVRRISALSYNPDPRPFVVLRSCMFMGSARSGSYFQAVKSTKFKHRQLPRKFDPKDLNLWDVRFENESRRRPSIGNVTPGGTVGVERACSAVLALARGGSCSVCNPGRATLVSALAAASASVSVLVLVLVLVVVLVSMLVPLLRCYYQYYCITIRWWWWWWWCCCCCCCCCCCWWWRWWW